MRNFEDYLRQIWDARIVEARAKALEEAAEICETRAEAHKRMCRDAADDSRAAILAAAWAVEAEECAKAIRRGGVREPACYVVRVANPGGDPRLIGPFDDIDRASAVCSTYVNATVEKVSAP